MRRRGTSSGGGLPSIANIAGCTRKIANWSITLNISWRSNMAAPMIQVIWRRAGHRCNLHKGPNLTGIDPQTVQVVPLFHPRRDRWHEHFVFAGTRIQGISATGRATVQVLAMNDARRLEVRREVLKYGDLT
jgi:hypothetical protein